MQKHPTGTTLIRLKDLPLEQRLLAFGRAVKEAKTEAEAVRMLRIALDPGDKGGRIAA